MKQTSLRVTPMVSVVIPTYRREELLRRSLRSALRQDYPRLEIWVVDQDPARRLTQLCAAELADPRVVYVNLPSAGASRAKNHAIERARGEILLFLDDDAHALTQSWASSYVRAFQRLPEVGLATGKILGEWLGELPGWFPREYAYLLGQYDLGDADCPMPDGHVPLGGNMGGRTSVIRAAGGFDVRFGYNRFSKRSVGGEDSLLGQRACEAGWKMHYCAGAVAGHFVSADKLSRRFFVVRNYREGVSAIERLAAMGQISSLRLAADYHLREMAMALARFLLPRYADVYDRPANQIRMVAARRIAYSAGVLRGCVAGAKERRRRLGRSRRCF